MIHFKQICIAVFFIILFMSPVGFAGEIVWVTDDTPGGYYIKGGGLTFDRDAPGLEIELYQMVAEQLGIKVVFKRLPWNRCLQLVGESRVDGIFPASFKAERMEIGVYPMRRGLVDSTRKTRNNAYFLYKLKDDPLSWDGVRFSNIHGRIGAPLGWAVVDDLKQKNVSVTEVTRVDQTVLKLITHKRIQGFVCLETVMDYYIQSEADRFAHIVKLEPPVREKPYYLMLSRQFVDKHPHLSERLWNTIRDIKQSGQFNTLLRKYVAP